MPSAIDFSTWVDLEPREDRKLTIYSENFEERVEVNLDQLDITPRRHWSDYVLGVALLLEKAGHRLRGASLTISSDIPLGSGLSSSAAIEVATAFALMANSGFEIDRTKLALLCQQAENEFVGARVGIMDQFASLHGSANNALLLDCRTLKFELLPLPQNVSLVICNTMVKHELASSAYNERRAECEAGVVTLRETIPGVSALRDVTIDQLERFKDQLPDVVYRRCRHVVTENLRTVKAGDALKQGDVNKFGELMMESHESLRIDYEVSCPELDVMVNIAKGQAGVYGTRMTGGGFGGCTINLVEQAAVQDFTRHIESEYQRATNLVPEIYVTNAANGAEEIF